MKVFIYYKGRVQLDNQTVLMEELSSKEYTNILYLPALDSRVKKDLKKEFELYRGLLAKGGGVIELTPYLDYFSVFMFILAVLTEDKNGATESKCQNYFSIKSLWELLEMSQECWLVKNSVVLFYFHVYCDTEKELFEE